MREANTISLEQTGRLRLTREEPGLWLIREIPGLCLIHETGGQWDKAPRGKWGVTVTYHPTPSAVKTWGENFTPAHVVIRELEAPIINRRYQTREAALLALEKELGRNQPAALTEIIA